MMLEWIAERTLSANGVPLLVAISAPVQMPYQNESDGHSGENLEWICHFEISINGVSERFGSRGVDPWMALICGLTRACATIDERFPDARWLDYEHPGMHVLHSVVFRSKDLQREFEKRLEESSFEIRRNLGTVRD